MEVSKKRQASLRTRGVGGRILFSISLNLKIKKKAGALLINFNFIASGEN
jgi:hypothetical protein